MFFFRKTAICLVFAFVLVFTCSQVFAQTKGPGRIPFDYPVVKTTAKTGDFVLCPPRLWIDDAFKKGADKQTFIFYTANMVSPGPAESKVKTLTGTEEIIPNSMIIPIKKGETAKVGDILLSWWQSGSGMQRAIVVKGGTPKEPKVMYLDLDYENPAGVGKKVDTLKPDSFHKIKTPMEPGTAVAFKNKGNYEHAILINESGGKVLLIGFAGIMKVGKKSDCVPLPIKPPALKKGAKIMIPVLGGFKEAVVLKVDPAIGRVFAEYLFASKKEKNAAAFGNIILKLP
ncbi:MAG: hypothetical protein LWY06_08365 [Firmicutes bacterium]|nr:hypothetical protein [Bacillota bacterium]